MPESAYGYWGTHSGLPLSYVLEGGPSRSVLNGVWEPGTFELGRWPIWVNSAAGGRANLRRARSAPNANRYAQQKVERRDGEGRVVDPSMKLGRHAVEPSAPPPGGHGEHCQEEQAVRHEPDDGDQREAPELHPVCPIGQELQRLEGQPWRLPPEKLLRLRRPPGNEWSHSFPDAVIPRMTAHASVRRSRRGCRLPTP